MNPLINEQKTLFVGAHPDDVFIAAATNILKHPENSYVLTITNGAPPFAIDYPKFMSDNLVFDSYTQYGFARVSEEKKIMGILDVFNRYTNLFIPDQKSSENLALILEKIKSLVDEQGIQRIVTHEFPQAHPDHEVACICSHLAGQSRNVEVWEYPMYRTIEGCIKIGEFDPLNNNEKLEYVFNEPETHFKDKAIRCYKSQPHIRERYKTTKEVFAKVERNLSNLEEQTDYIQPFIREATPKTIRLALNKFIRGQK